MGIATFGLTAPYIPRLGMVNLTNSQIGSLASVIDKAGEDAKDWRFDTGVIGIVLRTENPEHRIHVAFKESELTSIDFDTFVSGRTSAKHEIGFLGIGTPERFDGEKYNVYFRVTDSDGAPQSSRVFIELYFNIA